MSKIIGYDPKPKTTKFADDFENRVIIRRNNRSLLPRVFADIEEDEWKVAFGFNQTKIPKLHAKENDFEVLYRYNPHAESMVTRLGTDDGSEHAYVGESFSSPDDFIIWALGQEKQIQLSPA
jgi:hypothetical protein